MPLILPRRREILTGVAAALVVPAFTPIAVASTPLIVTPGQTEGPFYPVQLPADMDADLVRVQGQAAQAVGQVTHVSAACWTSAANPSRGDAGDLAVRRQRHLQSPGDSGQKRRDAAFQGYGRTVVDGEGRYAFRTIRRLPTRAAPRTSTSRCTPPVRAA
jgi:protocatechuate 3,4-dioxygenase beta subunit